MICDIYPKELAWRWVGWWRRGSRRGEKVTVMLESRKKTEEEKGQSNGENRRRTKTRRCR